MIRLHCLNQPTPKLAQRRIPETLKHAICPSKRWNATSGRVFSGPRVWVAARRILIPFGACLLAVGSARADVETSDQDTYTLGAEETLEQELWLSADQATFQGHAKEDISVFASTIELAGEFDGDIQAFGTRQLTFSGHATDQVRLGGNQIRFSGHAEQSVLAAAVSISLDKTSRIDDSAALFGDTVITDGVQHGNLWVVANTATIQGELFGNLRIVAGDIVIQPGTRIHGNVTYTSSAELVPGSKVEIGGELVRREAGTIGLSYQAYLLIQLIFFLSAILLAIPLIRLFPRTVGLSAGFIREAPGRCALTGIVALWVLPLFAIACLVFPFTIPLGLVVLSGLFFFGFIAQIVVALIVGSLVLRQKTGPSFGRVILTVIIGLLLLYILSSAPILNLLVWLIVLTVGFGGLILGNLASQQVIRVEKPDGGDPETDAPPPPLPPTDSDSDLSEPKE